MIYNSYSIYNMTQVIDPIGINQYITNNMTYNDISVINTYFSLHTNDSIHIIIYIYIIIIVLNMQLLHI